MTDIGNTTRRGFTFQEHLDNIGLVHMNGRVYDPTIVRFLSADPFVMQLFATQGLNRYSYVSNNPLSYFDPTGFGEEEPEIVRPDDADTTGVEEFLVTADRPHLDNIGQFLSLNTGTSVAYGDFGGSASDGGGVEVRTKVPEKPSKEACVAAGKTTGGCDSYFLGPGFNQISSGFSSSASVELGRTGTAALSQSGDASLNDNAGLAETARPTPRVANQPGDIVGFAGAEAGTDLFAVLFGVSGASGALLDRRGTACMFNQVCVQIGVGGFAGVSGQAVGGFSSPLENGTAGAFGFFAVGSAGAGGFGTLDVNSSSLTGGAGFAEGIGGAIGLQFCRIDLFNCQ
jgi:RHS repeat-associated protein